MPGLQQHPLARTALGVQGAEEAAARGDVVVVVDALRASVTIACALVAGAKWVVPVATVEEAAAYLGRAGFVVAGERGGARIPAFPLGNSPTEMLRRADLLSGTTLILTTSNGTRCVAAARRGAAAILAGALPNATAVARMAYALARQHGVDITLLAAGRGGGPAIEDTFTVRVLERLIAPHPASPHEGERLYSPRYREELEEGQSLPSTLEREAREVFLNSPAGQNLLRLGYREDVLFCAQVDTLDVAPLYGDKGFCSHQSVS